VHLEQRRKHHHGHHHGQEASQTQVRDERIVNRSVAESHQEIHHRHGQDRQDAHAESLIVSKLTPDQQRDGAGFARPEPHARC
jgi:hypothetical protein